MVRHILRVVVVLAVATVAVLAAFAPGRAEGRHMCPAIDPFPDHLGYVLYFWRPVGANWFCYYRDYKNPSQADIHVCGMDTCGN